MDREFSVLNTLNHDPEPVIHSPGTETQDNVEGDLSVNWDLFTATSSWEPEPPQFRTSVSSNYPSLDESAGSENSVMTLNSSTDRGKPYLFSVDNNPASQYQSPTLDPMAVQYEETPSPIQMPLNSWQQHPLFGSFVDDLMKSHEQQSAAKRERRKEQNRKAQQAYRERREQRFEVLRHKIQAAEKHCESQFHQIRSLQCDLTRLKDERESLRKLLQCPDPPSPTNASTPRLKSGEAKWDDEDEDDLLAYSVRRRATG